MNEKRATMRRTILLSFGLWIAAGCSSEQAGGGFSMPPTPVETAVVSRGEIVDRFSAVGTIEAGDAIKVVSEIDEAVRQLPFAEGERIAKGGLIAQLDDRELRAELDRAAALRDQSQTSYDRIKLVVEKGAAAAQDLDDAAAKLKVAEADLALARTRLEKTRITSPFAGILGSRRVSPGAFLRTGDVITELAKIDEIKVTFSAPERYISSLRVGSEVSVSTTAFPGESLSGTIDVIEPVLDPSTRSVRVIARLSNPQGRFRPGMSADVSAVLSRRDDALTVPAEAIFAEGEDLIVYVVQPDSTVARTPITIGTRLRDVVEVLDGVEPGAAVVRAGHQKLFPGAKVMPIGGGETAQ